MKVFTIYFKKNYGGGTQVLDKVSDALDAQKIYLFESSIFNFFKIIFKLKNFSNEKLICSDPIAGIVLFFFRINFIRFVQGKDTIYFNENYNFILNFFYKILYKLSFKQKVIYNSDFIKNWVKNNFNNIEFLGKISPGTDYQTYSYKKEYDYIYIYRKYGWKNTKFFCENLNIFENNEKVLVINSDRLDLSKLEKANNCEITVPNKFVTIDELNHLFSKSKFFISTTIDEGFGMPALEAMTTNCLPIVPDIGGTNDFCINGFNSIHFTNNDPQSFNDAIKKARSLNDLEYKKIVKNAHYTSKKYSWKNTHNNAINLKDLL